jgi:large subunit ribosomal protein L12
MEYIYAALLLHKLGKQIDEESLNRVVSAAGVQVDAAKVKTLIAALNGVDISKELENAGKISVGAAAPATSAGADKKEEKKEEKPSESAAGLASLFG